MQNEDCRLFKHLCSFLSKWGKQLAGSSYTPHFLVEVHCTFARTAYLDLQYFHRQVIDTSFLFVHSVFWVSSSYLSVNIVVLNQFTVTCIKNFASWLKRVVSVVSRTEKRFKFQAVDDIPEKKAVDLCKQMSSSKCSFTCICQIFLPLNPSTTTVYARSSFYPSQRFRACLQGERVTLALGLPQQEGWVSSGLQANFTGGVILSSGSTLPALLTCFDMRDIFCNGQKFEITLKFSVENTLNSQKRKIIINVDRK